MADKKFNQLPALVTPALTDIYAGSANGVASFGETREQMQETMRNSMLATNNAFTGKTSFHNITVDYKGAFSVGAAFTLTPAAILSKVIYIPDIVDTEFNIDWGSAAGLIAYMTANGMNPIVGSSISVKLINLHHHIAVMTNTTDTANVITVGLAGANSCEINPGAELDVEIILSNVTGGLEQISIWGAPTVGTGPPPVLVSGNKTLAITDAGKIQYCTAAADVTIPPHAGVGLPIGTKIGLTRQTAGVVKFIAGAGVTLLEPSNSYAVNFQKGLIWAYQALLNTWIITGNPDNVELQVITLTASTTLSYIHWGKRIIVNSASAVTITLPQQSTEATNAGTFLQIVNIGVGDVTLAKQGSETLTGNTLLATNAVARVSRDTTTNWSVSGGTSVLTSSVPFTVDIVGNNTYSMAKMPFTGTIINLHSISRSGTCTATFSINAVTITATANSVSTTSQTQSPTANNIFIAGDYLNVAVTSNSSCLGMNLNIDFMYRVNI